MEGGPKQYTEADVKRALISSGVQITEHAPVSAPTAINYEDLLLAQHENQNESLREVIRQSADACARFLSGPLIADQLTDHAERRKWRIEMSAKYGDAMDDFYSNNKLRINSIAPLHMILTTLGKKLRINKIGTERARAIQALIEQFPDLGTYETATIEEKVAFVSKIDTICESFLATISSGV